MFDIFTSLEILNDNSAVTRYWLDDGGIVVGGTASDTNYFLLHTYPIKLPI